MACFPNQSQWICFPEDRKHVVSIAVGQKLGPYYLHERLNQGGMATIWHATDGDGTPYAIKIMLDEQKGSFTARRRFNKGCEILQTIGEHPYIISYVEHGKLDGYPFLAMEYVEASNLKELADAGDDTFEQYIGNILVDVAEALEHMHDCGYMHLDFKPANVLMTRNGNVRLVDFDLTREIPKKPKKSSGNPGTPAFMAPEQLEQKPFDHRVDIFAFGVTAYELLTGKKPFPGEKASKVFRNQMDRNMFLSPKGVNDGVPRALNDLIVQCLENDPDSRFPNMNVLVAQLKSALYK